MSLTSKRYGFSVGGHWVEVLGETRAVNPEWSIAVDGRICDSKEASGGIELETTIDKDSVVAHIQQGNFGDVSVEVRLNGKVIQSTTGFLL